MHIASLEAHTTLNIYNLCKLSLRGHFNTDAQTAWPQLHMVDPTNFQLHTLQP